MCLTVSSVIDISETVFALVNNHNFTNLKWFVRVMHQMQLRCVLR